MWEDTCFVLTVKFSMCVIPCLRPDRPVCSGYLPVRADPSDHKLLLYPAVIVCCYPAALFWLRYFWLRYETIVIFATISLHSLSLLHISAPL